MEPKEKKQETPKWLDVKEVKERLVNVEASKLKLICELKKNEERRQLLKDEKKVIEASIQQRNGQIEDLGFWIERLTAQ